jgi:hypothetical protein
VRHVVFEVLCDEIVLRAPDLGLERRISGIHRGAPR